MDESKLMRKPGELKVGLKAIRRHCLGCGNGSRKEVALCPVTSCFLWPLRFGSNKRGRRIVAEERDKVLTGTHWADEVDDYTEQGGHRAEIAQEW